MKRKAIALILAGIFAAAAGGGFLAGRGWKGDPAGKTHQLPRSAAADASPVAVSRRAADALWGTLASDDLRWNSGKDRGHAIRSFVKLAPWCDDGVPAPAFRILLERLRQIKSRRSPAGDFAALVCCSRAVDFDPEATMELIADNRPEEGLFWQAASQRHARVRGRLLAWGATQSAEARAQVVDILDALERKDIAAIAAALQGGFLASDSSLFNDVIRAAGAVDPQAAFDAFSDIRMPGMSLGRFGTQSLARAIYDGWGDIDALAAFHDALGSGRLPPGDSTVISLAEKVMEQDLLAGIDVLEKLENGAVHVPLRLQRNLLQRAIKALAASHAERALAFVRGELKRADWQREGVRAALDTIAESDPERAAQLYAAESHTPNASLNLVSNIARAWGERDRDAAVQWASSFEGSLRAAALENALVNASDTERAKHARQFLEAGDGAAVESMVSRFGFSHRSVRPLLELGDLLPDDLRARLVAAEAAYTAGSDPGGVEVYLAELSPDAMSKSRRDVQTAITKWTGADPAAAAAWVGGAENLDAQNRLDAAYNVAANWARFDPSAASAWVDELPEGSARDGGALGLAERIVAREPDAALAWIATVTDDRERQRFFREHAGTLNRLAPDAARQLVDAGLFGDGALEQLETDTAWREAARSFAAKQ